MSDDPYKVLGVDRKASEEDIRQAYRRLAKELHPDLNPGDAKAEERFKKVTAAYDLLRDPEKRARYDRGEIDASGAERPEAHFYRRYADGEGGHQYYSSAGFEDFGESDDLFAELFGRGARVPRRSFRMRGVDVRYHLKIGFMDAVKGGRQRVTLPDGSTLDVRIPEGTHSGQVLRLKGKGMPGVGGGPPGDALVEIEVAPHPLFSRRGDDILVEIPITLDEAVLGGRIRVPTISGTVAMTVPRGSSSGRTLRLRGKGVHNPRTGRRGDQLVTLRIVLPDRIDEDLESFMRSWRKGHAYDPRAEIMEKA